MKRFEGNATSFQPPTYQIKLALLLAGVKDQTIHEDGYGCGVFSLLGVLNEGSSGGLWT